MSASPLILVTNDDGVHAEGIRALAEAVASLGEVQVVAPATEQSAVGHSITMRNPLRAKSVAEGWYAVEGTPTDCVMLAVQRLLPRPPALVMSGVNHGTNLGDDVTYSGTVSAAIEGTLLQVPSIAVSLDVNRERHDFALAADYARRVAERVLKHGLPDDTLLNINVPGYAASEIAGTKWTSQGRRTYEDVIVEKTDPRGQPYYWIGGGKVRWTATHGTDIEAIRERYVSITPIHLDLTNYDSLQSLREWKFD